MYMVHNINGIKQWKIKSQSSANYYQKTNYTVNMYCRELKYRYVPEATGERNRAMV